MVPGTETAVYESFGDDTEDTAVVTGCACEVGADSAARMGGTLADLDDNIFGVT